MIKLSELAKIIGARVLGQDLSVNSLVPMENATNTSGDIAAAVPSLAVFFKKSVWDTEKTAPCAVLSNEVLGRYALENGSACALVSENTPLLLLRAIDVFFPREEIKRQIHKTAFVHPEAKVHKTVCVDPMAVIEKNVTIKEGSFIGASAVICQDTVIGKNSRIGPGAVIGHTGFGYAKDGKNLKSIRHVGNVVIEADVEIGANTCVDKATLGTTKIKSGTMIDNLVQIGHNCKIGSGVLIAGQSGLAGSVNIGDNVMIGGMVGIADHIKIGYGAKVAAKSGVIGDVEKNEVVAGYPAMKRKKWFRSIATLIKLGSRKKNCKEQS